MQQPDVLSLSVRFRSLFVTVNSYYSVLLENFVVSSCAHQLLLHSSRDVTTADEAQEVT